MKTRILMILIILLPGCASSMKPPQYTLIEATEQSPTQVQEAVSVEGGWEFRFPKSVQIQKVAIELDGKLNHLTFYTKTEGKWKRIRTVAVDDISPSEIALHVTTNTIRIDLEPVKSGQITFCRFYVKKPQKIFSIPLEKPPFIK